MAGAAAVAPARAAAFELLTREAAATGAFDLNAAANDAFAGLDRRDRALAYELAIGTIKRRHALDRVIAACAEVASGHTRPAVREALRLGAFQLLYLDRVPGHAAVSESVELAKRSGRRDGAFANAVLRRVAAGGADALARLAEGESAEAAAVRHSHPAWLVSLWRRELGPEATEALLASDNLPAERCVRVNLLRATSAQAIAALAADGIVARPAATAAEGRGEHDWPDALLLDGAPLEGGAALRDGLVTPQSRASQLAAAVATESLEPAAAGSFADLCAAPGIKTSQIAAALPGWRVDAVDDDPRRAVALRANLSRLGAGSIAVVERDVLELGDDPAARDRYGGVLLDAPCSGLGTLAARPDLRWRRRPADVERLAALQRPARRGGGDPRRAGRHAHLLGLHAHAGRDARRGRAVPGRGAGQRAAAGAGGRLEPRRPGCGAAGAAPPRQRRLRADAAAARRHERFLRRAAAAGGIAWCPRPPATTGVRA